MYQSNLEKCLLSRSQFWGEGQLCCVGMRVGKTRGLKGPIGTRDGVRGISSRPGDRDRSLVWLRWRVRV